jgi:uncharacterized small protein (DUF1192 family)
MDDPILRLEAKIARLEEEIKRLNAELHDAWQDGYDEAIYERNVGLS